MSDIKDDKIKDKQIVVTTIKGQLADALEKGKRVQIYAAGTYKGIGGKVVGLNHGMVTLQSETEEGEEYTTTLKIADIKRVSIFGK